MHYFEDNDINEQGARLVRASLTFFHRLDDLPLGKLAQVADYALGDGWIYAQKGVMDTQDRIADKMAARYAEDLYGMDVNEFYDWYIGTACGELIIN